ncbi:Protein of unknown function [Gryllus bimaculatus]|nr:Protein of unknown function [Gryllus bimaculatus]
MAGAVAVAVTVLEMAAEAVAVVEKVAEAEVVPGHFIAYDKNSLDAKYMRLERAWCGQLRRGVGGGGAEGRGFNGRALQVFEIPEPAPRRAARLVELPEAPAEKAGDAAASPRGMKLASRSARRYASNARAAPHELLAQEAFGENIEIPQSAIKQFISDHNNKILNDYKSLKGGLRCEVFKIAPFHGSPRAVLALTRLTLAFVAAARDVGVRRGAGGGGGRGRRGIGQRGHRCSVRAAVANRPSHSQTIGGARRGHTAAPAYLASRAGDSGADRPRRRLCHPQGAQCVCSPSPPPPARIPTGPQCHSALRGPAGGCGARWALFSARPPSLPPSPSLPLTRSRRLSFFLAPARPPPGRSKPSPSAVIALECARVPVAAPPRQAAPHGLRFGLKRYKQD